MDEKGRLGRCQNCGAALTGDAREAFCPKCLFRLAAPVTESKSPQAEEEIGALIGRYQLLEKIGEGGFGAVYVAEQREPVKRRVALKLIKMGMDTRQVVARFEAERQALALMDHPNIARVLDGGATPAGRSYFVMELVRGTRITEYCDRNNLPTGQRLNLFIRICHAIQHAHQKGIIHRDIKPSNILVTVVDGEPVPKVIDFGIAKATQGSLTEETVYTQWHQFIGTPAYMSPEQAQWTGTDVDTRSDVYSLGVLLYELLTGHTPFDAQSLRAAGLEEMRRIVQDKEPVRPSTRISTLDGAQLATVARHRQVDPATLSRLVRGDLDWIVMKCLEKNRARRYETSNALAEDIERHLKAEPVSAAAPTLQYRVAKFARRNRAALLTGGALAGLLIAGTVVSAWQAVRATHAERSQRQLREQADQQAAIARAVSAFLQNDLLRQADSRAQAEANSAVDPNLTVREALERASRRIGDRFKDQPLTEAAIRMVIGDALQAVGRQAESVPHLLRSLELTQASLGADHLETLKCMDHLAAAYADAGDLGRALPLLEKALQVRQRKLGAVHPDTLTTMHNLGYAYQQAGKLELALGLLEQTLQLRRRWLGVDDPSTLDTMAQLVEAYYYAGQYARSLETAEETLKLRRARLGPDHPDTLVSIHNLASVYGDAGKGEQALALYQENLKSLTATLGPDDPHTLACLHNLGATYTDLGEFDRATELLEQVLGKRRVLLGSDHPHTLLTMLRLIQAYEQAGDLERAVPLNLEALELAKSKLGPEHFISIGLMDVLARGQAQAGNLETALALHQQTRASIRATLGPNHPFTLLSCYFLGRAYLEADRLDEGKLAFEEALNSQRSKLGPDHPDTLDTMAGLTECLLRQGNYTNAESLARDCLERCQKTSPKHWRTFAVQISLGMALSGQKKYDEAEVFLVAGYAGLKQVEHKIPARFRGTLRRGVEGRVQLYEAWGKPEEAARCKRELK